jgi:hypothetical protein
MDKPHGLSAHRRTPLCTRDKAPQQDPVEHSVYLGRERLGRYLKIHRKRYVAFDAGDCPLGSFRTRPKALAAIRRAQKVRS